MSRIVDLRSDTVTRPVSAMRSAIANAEVGDDVFGDDPTVNSLEEKTASLFGTERALFLPSGTMSNQVALATITRPGDEVIIDRQAHIFNNEVAASAALFGVQFNPLDGDSGVITADRVAAFIRRGSLHQPATTAVVIENTHNRAGGHVFPLEEMQRIRALANEHGIRVHLDGARLANAVVATGSAFSEYAACADTINMCFSKGLGAPVGSILCGTEELISMARRKRKQFGGGMRQAGVLAAAALFALENHIDRLSIDHDNARKLGEIINAVDGVELEYPVETNIVIFRVDAKMATGPRFVEALASRGVLAGSPGSNLVRMVTHLDVDAHDIDFAGDVLRTLEF